jgi:hypothetical protein
MKSSTIQYTLILIVFFGMIYYACSWYIYRDNCTALGGTYVKTPAGWKCQEVKR